MTRCDPYIVARIHPQLYYRRSDQSGTDNANSHKALLAITSHQPFEILDNIDVSDNDAGKVPHGDDS